MSSRDAAQEAPANPTHPPDRFAWRAVFLLLALFLATSASGMLSEGFYHEDDVTHFMFARWVPKDARYLLDEWGRPGFTVLYALPAVIGSEQTAMHACRLLSAVLTAATAWLAYRIARHLRLRHAWATVALVYLQPLAVHLSLTTLTETPLAFYFALATWLIIRQRPAWAAAVIGITLVTRHEAIVLLPIWAVAFRRMQARWAVYPLMLWAPALHNALAAVFLDTLPLQRLLEPGTSAPSAYGHGTPLTFVPRLLLSAGPIVTALAIIGSRCVIRRRGGWLIVLLPAAYFAAETAIYAFGAFASGGYPRFLVPMAPWLAVLATAGVEPILLGRSRRAQPAPRPDETSAGILLHPSASRDASSSRRTLQVRAILPCGLVMVALWIICELEWWWRPPVIPTEWARTVLAGRVATALVVVLFLLALVRLRTRSSGGTYTLARRYILAVIALAACAPPAWAIRPLSLTPVQSVIANAVAPLNEPPWNDRQVLAINYGVYYWSGRWIPQPRARDWANLAGLDPGTLFAWDNRLCPGPDFGLNYIEFFGVRGWRLAWESAAAPGASVPAVAFFEREQSPQTSRSP